MSSLVTPSDCIKNKATRVNNIGIFLINTP